MQRLDSLPAIDHEIQPERLCDMILTTGDGGPVGKSVPCWVIQFKRNGAPYAHYSVAEEYGPMTAFFIPEHPYQDDPHVPGIYDDDGKLITFVFQKFYASGPKGVFTLDWRYQVGTRWCSPEWPGAVKVL